MIPAAGTVFVVDDNAAVRASLRTLFGAAGLHVETYASGADFLAAYDSRRPGCLVLDLKLRGESGLDLLEQLPPRPATLPVIVLTAYGSVPASVRAMNAGAIDFVEKSMRPAQLLGCVRTALELAGRQHEVEAAQQAIVQRAARLTPREQQIAELLVAGKRSKEIAASLGVSPRTVDSYRSRLLDKMHVESTTELIAALLRLRRVPPRECTVESAAFRDADPLVGARLAFGQPATAITLPATLLRQRLSSPSADLQMPRDSIEAWGASAPARATSSRRSSRLSKCRRRKAIRPST